MANQRATSIPAGGADVNARDRAGSRFFFVMSILLMAIVLIGFGRNLYFRPFFDRPPMDGHLLLHGLILTGWYVLLIAQTSLIQTARTAAHRRLGIFGAFWGVLVVIGGQIANLNMVERVVTTFGVDLDAIGVNVAPLSEVIWSGVESSFVFAILVAAAILLRGRSAAHKRLILLASILAVGPAVNRIADWAILGGGGSASLIPRGPVGRPAKMLLLAAIAAHDLRTTRRVHPATLVGGALVLMQMFGLPSKVIANTEFGIAFTRSLQ